jgi:hypothetical protein
MGVRKLIEPSMAEGVRDALLIEGGDVDVNCQLSTTREQGYLHRASSDADD